MDYLLLALAAFLAATVLPFYSEALYVPLLVGGCDPLALWLAASIGNTAGAVVNWLIGWFLAGYRDRRWFPVKAAELERGQRWFQRYGVWTLLLSWLPIGGDAITFVAGIMKVRLRIFLCLTFAGKSARYAVLWYLTAAALG